MQNASSVTLKIIGINGQSVATLIDGIDYSVGDFSIDFNAKTNMQGMYYFVLRTKNDIQMKKVVINKR